MTDDQKIGRQVVRRRKQLGLTRAALAERVGISEAQISKLERGGLPFRNALLAQFAQALGVKPVYFYVWPDEFAPRKGDEFAPRKGDGMNS